MCIIEDELKDGQWETAIGIISSISFSQIEPRSVKYIVRKLQIVLKGDNLDKIIDRIKSSINDTEDNVGIVAGIIFEILGEKELTILREKVAKNENFCDYVQELFFELSFKDNISNCELIKK